MINRLSIATSSSLETEELGRRLGSLLDGAGGMFIALRGELGGGKTCFTRGIVSGAAPESAHLVASPTFAIMNEYPASHPIHHFDFYRLTCGHEIVELGFEDYFQGDGICIAEWAERVGELLPADHLNVTFTHGGGDRRTIALEADGPGSAALLARLADLLKSEKTL